MVEEALAAADRHQASLRTQVTLLKQSHAAAQEEITRLRSLLTQRNVNVPPIAHFPHRRRPESYYVGDAKDPDSERTQSSRSSGSSELRQENSPRSCAENVPTQATIGDSDWISLDLVATIVAGLDVGRIGVGFLNLPPVPLVVKRVTRGSWADQQGIQCGDEFMSVDHRRSRAFTPSEFTAAMKKRPLVIKLRRTARKGGPEAEMSLRGFGVDAIAEERSDPSERSERSDSEEEEEEESDSDVEEMCPERAQEVAEKLAREVEENARKEQERLHNRRRASTGDVSFSPSRSNSFTESLGSRTHSVERRYSTGSDQFPSDRRPFWPDGRMGALSEAVEESEWSKPKQLANEWMVQMLHKATSPSSTTDAFSTSVESTPASMAPTKAETEDEFF